MKLRSPYIVFIYGRYKLIVVYASSLHVFFVAATCVITVYEIKIHIIHAVKKSRTLLKSQLIPAYMRNFEFCVKSHDFAFNQSKSLILAVFLTLVK